MKTLRRTFYTVLLAILAFSAKPVSAQNTDPSVVAPFLRYPTIPPFEIKTLDGKTIHREDLAKRQGTLIMFFSPDCHHCTEQVESIKAIINDFQKYNLVLATYQPMNDLQLFYDRYKLSEWKNLYLGRDEKFFFPPYYKIANLPFIALYDRKGNLLTSFQGTTPADKVLNGFAKKN
ncbi:TlpA family protein disulfide reductase [Flavihumibacter profundi]|jgi:hypothetical protein|uniref:TlpA family protein disulfide reductase n=1 Tax=Flavihumibacter profundi TaxID=2716883 RepID=UPI001CC4B3D3|nr:redoxin domain-containing protein [Flavihumibacter profundi]MBZ5857062.1 redoxin domain-containing protein [Flavihumibacter profundi]